MDAQTESTPFQRGAVRTACLFVAVGLWIMITNRVLVRMPTLAHVFSQDAVPGSYGPGESWTVLVLVALYLLVMLWWMLPVPGLSVPVAIYMLVLTAMVMAATMVNATHPWIAIGAILFLLSDSLIALSTFKQVVGGRLAGFLIWSTYYLAQYLMTFGFMLTKTQRKHG